MINNLDILLIDEETIKQKSIVMNNVEDQFFRPSIIDVQNIQFQEAVCEDLYEEIIDQFTDYKTAISSGTTQPIETFVEPRILTLVDIYAQPIIMNYTLYDASYSFYSKVANKGIVNQSSENSETADSVMMDKLRKQWKTKGEHYITVMTKFLVDNIDDYPEYKTCLENCEIEETRASNYTSMYLGDQL
jgi:hypothetical protein